MRYLLSLAFLFSFHLLGAQQCITASVLSLDCSDPGGFFINLEVTHTGNGQNWLTDINGEVFTGAYDTLTSIGPFFAEVGDLEFVDADDPDCTQVLVFDAPLNCITTDSCFVRIIEVRNAGCSGNDGEISIVGQGGVAPYAYLWSNGANTATATDLEPGLYTVTVTDAEGCATISTASVMQDSSLFVVVSQAGGECNPEGLPPTFSAEVQSGVAPYTFAWATNNNVISTDPTLEQVDTDVTYILEVTDATGCSFFGSFTFESNVQTINFFAPFFLPCDGGAVTLSTGDETDFLEYQWLTPAGDTLFGPTVDVSEPGAYAVFGVSPDATCFVEGTAVVVEQTLANLEISSTRVYEDSTCFGSTCVFLRHENGFESLLGAEARWTLPDGSIIEVNAGQSICEKGPGLYSATVTGACDAITLTILVEGDVECSSLNGTLYVDQAGNCSLDGEDSPAYGLVVVATSVTDGEEFYAITNADGEYGFEIPVGDYTLSPEVDDNLPFGSCEPPAGGSVVAGSVTTVDLFLPVLLDCPLMTTSVSIPFLRRCFENVAYVEYGNVGSSSVDDAMLTVTLDEFLIDPRPSIPAASQVGNVFTFDLGTVNPFERERIFFTFTVSCEASLGQSHCIESVVSPSEPCTAPENWNGALVNVSNGRCDGDQITFSIQNVGDNPMSIPLSYVVVEDGIMMSGVPIEVESLPSGEVLDVNLPADGHTYHIITNQEPNAPASPTPTGVAEGCNTDPNGAVSTGFANIIALGNEVPSQAIACRANVGAYDPNDKMGYPLGFRGGNIAAGTRLDYAIRFQNTGTDTAFNIVIQDTLPEALDLATLKVGSASHPYTVAIDTHRVITFTFANIELPDSNVNLAGSQGVVNFSIDQVADLLPGDLIDNKAYIYFDFNEPIITNLSRHRIAKDGLPVSTRQQRAQQVAIGIFPNPGPGIIRLDLPGSEVTATDILSVTDLYGRQLATTTYGQLGRDWNVSHLPNGYYLLIVSTPNGQAKGRAGFVITR